MAPTRATATAKTHILKNCDLRTLLEPGSKAHTKFVATKVTITIGPATQDVDTLVELLEAGVTCARIDLTWGSMEFHKRSLDNLHEAQRRTRKLCAVMLDTTGRELMIKRDFHLDDMGWPQHEDELEIKAGQAVVLTQNGASNNNGVLSLRLSYEKFTSMCEVGDTIYMGRYLATGAEDSSVDLEVTQVSPAEVVCVAKNDCQLDGLITLFHSERSATALTNLQNDLPILCEHDKKAIEMFAKSYEIDFISLSYTRSKEDILEAREFVDKMGLTSTKLLAKCETRQSLFNFSQIVSYADGVIISRGNLGLDVLPEKMALTQKRMVSICNIAGKPCYITRVVDTMIRTPRPTRAEATDIANAVLDGVDGILLGAETLRGKYSVITVNTILEIASQAEQVFDHEHHYEYLVTVKGVGNDLEGSADQGEDEGEVKGLNFKRSSSMASMGSSEGPSATTLSSNWNLATMAAHLRDGSTMRQLSKFESIASSAVRAATKVDASLIIVYTHSGQTASLVAKYRPPMPILTLVVPTLQSDGLKWSLEGKYVARQCLIQHSLLPVLAAPSPSGETLLEEAVYMCSRKGLVNPGDHIVVVQQVHEDLTLKIVSVDDMGYGIKRIRPKSLADLVAAIGGTGTAALGKSFSVIGGGQELVHDDFESTSLSPRTMSRAMTMNQSGFVSRPAPEGQLELAESKLM